MKVKEDRRIQVIDKYDSASDEESGFGSQEMIGEPDSDDDYPQDAKNTEDADVLSEGVSSLCITSRGKDAKQKLNKKCSPYTAQVSTRNSYLQTGGTVLKPNFAPNYTNQTAQNFEQNIPTTVQNYKQPTNTYNIPQNIPQSSYDQYQAQNACAQYNFEPQHQNIAQNCFQNPTYHSNIFEQDFLSAQNQGSKVPDDFLSYTQNIALDEGSKNSGCSKLLSAQNPGSKVPVDFLSYTQNIPSDECSKNSGCSNFLSAQNPGSKVPVDFLQSYNPNIPSEGCSNLLSAQNLGSRVPKNYPQYTPNIPSEGCSKFLSGSTVFNLNIGAPENGTYGAQNVGSVFLNDSKIENYTQNIPKAQNDEILSGGYSVVEAQNELTLDMIDNILSQSQDSLTLTHLAKDILNSLSPLEEFPVLEDNLLEKEVPQNIPTVTVTCSEDYRDIRQSFSTESSISNIGSPESCNNWVSSPYSINSPYSSCSTDSSNISSSNSSSPVWNATYLDKVNIPTVIKDIVPQKTAKQKMQEIADKKPLIKRYFWDDYSLKHPKEFMAEKNGLNLIQEIVKNEKKDLLIRVFAAVTNLLKYCQPFQVNQVFKKSPDIIHLAKLRGIPLLVDYLSEILLENDKKIKLDYRNIE